jgi:hypothetical protein
VAVNGEVTVTARTRPTAEPSRHRLDAPDKGLYVPPRTWTTLEEFDDDTTVLVLTSERYDPDEYIEELEELR